ncbi:hypothetical protein SORBI_3005G065050 [Sorghum bicolor]|uniref:Uncharacterized protein n=1 Tax=Sorghum bicolor TaxID=4558 RepID=A0A1Z5RHX3_SORBI|nr:hypothetical protein SORBI_3005G065050 [Sorghum bicolor]
MPRLSDLETTTLFYSFCYVVGFGRLTYELEKLKAIFIFMCFSFLLNHLLIACIMFCVAIFSSSSYPCMIRSALPLTVIN